MVDGGPKLSNRSKTPSGSSIIIVVGLCKIHRVVYRAAHTIPVEIGFGSRYIAPRVGNQIPAR